MISTRVLTLEFILRLPKRQRMSLLVNIPAVQVLDVGDPMAVLMERVEGVAARLWPNDVDACNTASLYCHAHWTGEVGKLNGSGGHDIATMSFDVNSPDITRYTLHGLVATFGQSVYTHVASLQL